MEENKNPILEALTQGNCVDPETLQHLPELVEAVESGTKPEDAVAALRKRIPALFPTTDYAEMSPADFEKNETQLLESLRKPRQFGPTEFHGLDAGRLTPEEFQNLDRCVRGERNTWDRSVLTRALARQRNEDAVIAAQEKA